MAMRVLVVLASLAAACTAQVEVQTQLGARSCVLGEPLVYVVEVTVRRSFDQPAPAEAPRPEPPVAAEDYDLEFVRASTNQSRSLSIFNGRRSGHVDHVTTFLFHIKPKRVGRVAVPSWEYEIEGQRKRVAARTFLVEREAPGNRYVSVIVVASNDRPYVNQPVKIRYQLDTEKLVLTRDENRRLPEIDIPWADVPNGVWAVPFEDLAGTRTRSGMTVALNDQQFGLQEVRVPGDETQRFVFERTIYPLAPGRLALGGTSTRLSVATRVQRNRIGALQAVETARAIVNSEMLVLEVRDAPMAGRTASYTGVIGDFEGDARLSEGKIRAGDGLTMTLRLSGSGALESVTPPELTGFDEFDVYAPDRKVEGDGDTRSVTFSWLLVPKSTEVSEVPRFEFSWFNPTAEKFKAVSVGPMPLEITGEIDSDGIFESTITARRAAEIRTLGEGVRPLKESPGQITRGDGAGLVIVIGIALLPLISLLVTSLIVGRRRRLAGDESLVRRKHASKAATARLSEARALMESPRGFHGKLARCLSGFIGDKVGVPPASVSAATVGSILGSAGVADDVASDAARILADLDVNEFGGGGHDEEARRGDIARVERLIGDLDRVLKS